MTCWSLDQQPEMPHLLYLMNELVRNNENLLKFLMIDMNGVNLILDLYSSKLATSSSSSSSSSSTSHFQQSAKQSSFFTHSSSNSSNRGITSHNYVNSNNNVNNNVNNSNVSSNSSSNMNSPSSVNRYSHARRPTISSARGMMSPRLSPNNNTNISSTTSTTNNTPTTTTTTTNNNGSNNSNSQQQQQQVVVVPRPKLHTQAYSNMILGQSSSIRQEKTKSTDFSTIFTSPNNEVPTALMNSPRMITLTTPNSTTTTTANNNNNNTPTPTTTNNNNNNNNNGSNNTNTVVTTTAASTSSTSTSSNNSTNNVNNNNGTSSSGGGSSAMLSPLARATVLNLSALNNNNNNNNNSSGGGQASPARSKSFSSSSSVSFSLNLSKLNTHGGGGGGHHHGHGHGHSHSHSGTPTSSSSSSSLSFGGLGGIGGLGNSNNSGGMDSPASRLKIPPLSLPMKSQTVNTMTSYTRSSRRMNHDLNYVNLDNLKLSIDTLRTQHTATTQQLKHDKDGEKLFQSKTIVEYFGSLAAKLGELYIANDLTFLIPIKRDLDLQMASRQRQDHQKQDQQQTSGGGGDHPLETMDDEAIVGDGDSMMKDGSGAIDDSSDRFQFREDPILLLLDPDMFESITISRYFSLVLLQKLTRYHISRKISRNPVNMLMYELNNLSEEFRNDKAPARTPNEALIRSVKEEIFNIIYDILSQYAEDVEAKYFHLWRNYNDHAGKKIVYDPTRDRALKKFDIFLWRWAGIVDQILDNDDLVELEYQLKSLSRYLNSCISRVHASQCTAVCLETLLRIQVMARQMSHSSNGLNYGFFKNTIVNVIHYMLEIFDFIMDSPERHPLLMEFFYFNLVDNEDNFYWLREYAKFLLLNDDLDIEPQQLQTMRLRLMKHYQIIMNLFQDLGQEFLDQQQKRVKTPILTSVDSTVEEEEESNSVMKQFDFLVNPVDGLVLHFLTKGPIQQQYTVKREMLKLLDKIFRLPNLPFMHIESYVSTYLRYHYLNFVKLYISPATDPQTLEACTLHLNVLIAFSINKTPATTDRFFRMKVVRFLAREVSLEHEIDDRFKKHNALESKALSYTQSQNLSPDTSDSESDYDSETDDHTDSYTDRTDDSYLDSPHNQVAPPKIVPSLSLGAKSVKPPPTGLPTGLSLKLALPGSGGTDVKQQPVPSPKESSQPAQPSQPAPLVIKKPVIPPLGMMKSKQEEPVTAVATTTTPTLTQVQKPLIPSLSLGPKTGTAALSVPSINLGSVIKDNGNLVINSAKTSAKSSGRKSSRRSARHNDDDSSSDSGSEMDSDSDSPSPRSKTPSSSAFNIPSLSIGKKHNESPNIDDDMDDIASVRLHNPQPNLPLGLASKLKLKIGGASSPDTTPPSTTTSTPFKLALPQLPSTYAPSTVSRTSRSGSLHNDLMSSVTDRSLTTDRSDLHYGSDFDDDDEFNHEFESDSKNFMDRRFPFGNLLHNVDSQFFKEERKNRKLYYDENLHVAVLGLLISLLITKHDSLDSRYSDQFPLIKNMMNIPYMLHYHINDQSNEAIIPKLHDMVMTQMGLGARILLKLLCKKLFEPQLYAQRQKRIGFGAFGDVWRCELRFKHSSVRKVAVKLLKVPTSIDGPCLLYNIFNEILIMEKFKGDSRICRLYDYGLDKDYYYIVMKEYKCSLKKWRGKQKTPLALNMPLYLNIFKRLLESFKFLSDNNVNHFDIKCDNIFIDPYDGITEDEFYNHTTDNPCFEMTIGDFGESYVYSREHEDDGYTTRHRGTDCIKSPEMLKIEMMNNTSKFYDRRRKVGANSASDVWSLGCLFYELLSGEFLFDAEDFTNFFMIVTDENKTLISQERYMKINYNSLLMDILVYILIRDPVRRPSIADILAKYPSWQRMIPSREKLLQNMKNGIEWEEPKIQEDDDTASCVSSVKNDENTEDFAYDLATPHTNRRPLPHNSASSVRSGMSPLHLSKSPLNSSISSRIKITPLASATQKSAKDKGKEPPSTPQIMMQAYLWHKNDIQFYIRKATAIIKNRLFIVSEEIAGDKSVLNLLGITHVINCSVPNHAEMYSMSRNSGALKQKQLVAKFENNFFYMALKHHIADNPTQAYIEYLSAFEFVKDAIKKRGRVMIYSGKGLSRSGLFAVLFLMNTYNISSYEAYLSVKNHRPALRPEILTHFLHFLLRIQQQQSINKAIMEGVTLTSIEAKSSNDPSASPDIMMQTPQHSYQKIRQVKRKLQCISMSQDSATNLLQKGSNGHEVIHWYQCLCGGCVLGVISPFHLHRVTASNIKDDMSPLSSWPSFLQEMKLLYFYEGKHLNMGLTTRDKVLLDPFDVAQHTTIHETVITNDLSDDQKPPMWQIFKCKYCGFMVFAQRNITRPESYVSVARSGATPRRKQLHIRIQSEATPTPSTPSTATTATAANAQSDNSAERSTTTAGGTKTTSVPVEDFDICINATLKTANIVTTTLANKIQDLRPSLFFKMNSQ